MQSALSADVSRFYVNLVEGAIEDARLSGRTARGAWLKQRLRRSEPGFDERNFGFESFRDFLRALGEFDVGHDGYDIVATLERGGAVRRLDPPVSVVRTERRLPSSPVAPVRVAAELWKAFTRFPGSPTAYLDLNALREGRLNIFYEAAGPGDGSRISFAADSARYVEIPASTVALQQQWIADWANQMLPIDHGREIAALAQASDGLRRATARLYELGLAQAWIRDRSRRSIEFLHRWAVDQNVGWEPPVLEARTVGSPTPTAAAGGVLAAKPDLRKLATDAVSRMSEVQLRELNLPLGLVYDSFRSE